MLSNLKAELVRKNYSPAPTVAKVIGTTEKTARQKLDELSPISVEEALKIKNELFADDDFTLEYLFAYDGIKPRQ